MATLVSTIAKYVSEDPLVGVFAKMLKNECEEGFE